MFGKRTVLVALVAMGLMLSAVAVASADPSSGFLSVLIGRGQANRSFEVDQRKGNDVAVNQNTIQPAGYSGWHSHPGTTVIAVQSGQVRLFSERITGGRCRVRTYTAGQVFLEHPKNEYNAVNTGAEPPSWRSPSSTCRTVATLGSSRPTPAIARADPAVAQPGRVARSADGPAIWPGPLHVATAP